MIHGMPLAASLPPASVGGQTQQSLLRFTLLDFVLVRSRKTSASTPSRALALDLKKVCVLTLGPTQMWTQRLSLADQPGCCSTRYCISDLAHERAKPSAKARPRPSSQGWRSWIGVVMILPQVHLRKPCYDFSFL